MSLKGKTLFITGASRGIGLAIALRCARDGANIAIAAKTETPHPKLEGTIYTAAEQIEKAGGRALPLVVDVRDEDGGEGRHRQHGCEIRRHRHRGQQRQRSVTHAGRRHRHEALRPDAGDQHARHLHGVEIRHPVSGEGVEPAHPDELAAARHEGEVVRRHDRLFDRQIRHEPRGAGPCRRASRQGHRRQRAVAARHHRHRRDQEPARRRPRDADVAHARDHGGRGLRDLSQAGEKLHRPFPDRRHVPRRRRRHRFREISRHAGRAARRHVFRARRRALAAARR